MEADKKTIAIVGGGLAGLATAVGLVRSGHRVRVFEQASSLGEVGAGINISMQATRALQGLGLEPELGAAANIVTGQPIHSIETGDRIAYTSFTGSDAEERPPYYTFHRADLLKVLADAVGSEDVALGHRLTGITDRGDSVDLEFDNGEKFTADAVIGADGVHSTVRHALYGVDEAKFTGQVVWRALLDASQFPADVIGNDGFAGWVGAHRHIMVYFIRDSSIINVSAQIDTPEWAAEGWSIPGDPDEMRATFGTVAPQLQQILDKITSCHRWGLFVRQPSTDWGTGRIQLIGDAAHPMLPNAGQGAGQSFEDAYVLSRWLEEEPDPVQAFARFRDVRIPRASAIQRVSAQTTGVLHGKKGAGLEAQREEIARRESEGKSALGLSWIYDYDPVTEWSTKFVYPLSLEYTPTT
ncbi:MAG TPA: FAD-dependent monooxygenase [Pseudolysinimonas sp.]|nr:FAD-dependent monooxygenase [Pseudolysinimonas sp.]